MGERWGLPLRQRRCPHRSAVSVISDGVEHFTCESCGYVEVRYEGMTSASVARSQFARKADARDRARHVERDTRG